MPLVVLVKCINKLFVINTKWFQEENSQEYINNGLVFENYKEHTIFYSPNKDDAPNFDVQLENDFQEHKMGCYKAFIIKYFSKCFLLHIFISSLYLYSSY